jgi:hypothetical protein
LIGKPQAMALRQTESANLEAAKLILETCLKHGAAAVIIFGRKPDLWSRSGT